MSALQGLIFVAGLVVLVGIYAHWRWTQSRKARADEDQERLEPAWEGEDTWETEVPAGENPEDWVESAAPDDVVVRDGVATPPAAPRGSAATPPVLEPAPRAPTARESRLEGRVLVFYVMARDPQGFAGSDLAQVFRELHLTPGERDIFYRRSEHGTGAVYCVANALEPGRFDIKAMETLRTPGLTVFAVLPGPWAARDILAAMHRAALTLADRLGGEVLDGRRVPLTAMGYQSLLDELPAEA
ncbi:MAG TPA: cell division protein ZipA C-terminal FtsZ-binding domain-containing protein [Candidatus Acidoferrales bacterium]|nr:cell division protein ZipA C-terminal FtsZ-binding domain-containing protein [Candidatus Acidoferrales bacterium]